MDTRGHGASDRAEPPYEFARFGADVVAVLDPLDTSPVAVGHSSGGAALAIAQLLEPGLFSALVLIEPIIFPPPFERRWNPLVDVALRRRRSFPSRTVARERFAEGPFRSWVPEALDAYVDHGFEEVGDEWALRCAAEVEADVYHEGSNHDTWDRVEGLDVPVVIVAGEHSDLHHGAYLEALVAQFTGPELVIVPGAGHLVPMEDPDAVADIIASVLTTVG